MKDNIGKQSATLGNALTNVSRRITTSSVGTDNAPVRLRQPLVTLMTPTEQFEQLEIMPRERATLAKKEAEHWLAEAEYWLAEANEWRELRKSPEPVHGES